MAETPTNAERRVALRYRFDTWRGHSALDDSLFVHHYVVRGDELTTWDLERVRRAHPPGQVPVLKTMWVRPGAKSGPAIVGLDAFECDSREKAHELLLELLGQFQSPLVERVSERAVGDVCFSVPGATMFLFARANLVLKLRNAGPEVVSLVDEAAALDADLVRPPGRPDDPLVPGLALAVSTSQLPVGQRAELTVSDQGLLGGSVTVRLWSTRGEIEVIDDVLVYRALTPGNERISALLTNESGGAVTVHAELSIGS